MRTYLPHAVFFCAILFFTALNRVLLRRGNAVWWQKPWVRRLTWSGPALGMLGILGWALGTLWQNYAGIMLGATLAIAVVIVALASLLALPFASGLNYLAQRAQAERGQHTPGLPENYDASRRRFLQTAAAALPVFSISGGVSGMANSFEEIRTPVIRLRFPHLPADLSGLKILHLSDLHLGYYRGLHEMERLFVRLEKMPADLVLVTGDVADDLRLLPGILRMIDGLRPPLGAWASLGNHEYFRGIGKVRKRFEAGPVPLLCNAGQTLTRGAATLFIAGADDPRAQREGNSESFLRRTVSAALQDAPLDAFTVLLTHRPGGFDHAVDLGVALTLAGHTHGMQIGYQGRSLFEPWMPEKYLWGHYQKSKSQLYTSSGVGHWFPFRLGCPPEAPLIILQRA